jgi:hypothetical protein
MAKRISQKDTNRPVAAQTKSVVPGNRMLVIILAVVSLLVYANTLKNGYVLDDIVVIKNNSIVTKGASAIPELLTTPYHRGNFISNNDLYRPLSLIMFAIEYQAFDGSPTGSHFINILLFAGCVIILFLFFDSLFERKRTTVAFIAAMLFALHPIHTEVVANIKSRDELLCFFLSFLSLNIFMKYVRTGKMGQLLAGAACFFLSLLSKETAITFLAVIPLIFFFYANEDKKRSLYITAGVFAAAIIFLSIRFSVLSAYHANNISDIAFLDNPLVKATSFASKFATTILVLGNYIKLLILPYPLICDYSYNSIPLVGFGNMWVLLSMVVYIALAFISIYLLWKDRKDPFAFGILFFLFTISLFSNIPFLIGAMMAERFVFFASAGFCLLVALLIEKWTRNSLSTGTAIFKDKKAAGIVIAISVVYAFATIDRNSDWHSNTTLYSTDVKKAPNNARLFYYLGTDLIISSSDETNPGTKKQLIDEGIINLKNALTIYPGMPLAASEIGHEYFVTAQYDSAELYNKKAIVADPTDTNARNTLAAIYFYAKKYPESIEVSRNAVTLFPNYVRGYINIGSGYQHLNNYDSAVFYFKKAISVDPLYGSSYSHLVTIYSQMGNIDSVRKYQAMMRK